MASFHVLFSLQPSPSGSQLRRFPVIFDVTAARRQRISGAQLWFRLLPNRCGNHLPLLRAFRATAFPVAAKLRVHCIVFRSHSMRTIGRISAEVSADLKPSESCVLEGYRSVLRGRAAALCAFPFNEVQILPQRLMGTCFRHHCDPRTPAPESSCRAAAMGIHPGQCV